VIAIPQVSVVSRRNVGMIWVAFVLVPVIFVSTVTFGFDVAGRGMVSAEGRVGCGSSLVCEFFEGSW